MLNSFQIMGRLVADPELKYTQANIPVTTFRVACERNYKNADGETETDFFSVTAWRQKAEFICKYFVKGQMICIEGSIQQRKYTATDGSNRTVFEVMADRAHFCGGKKESESASTEKNAGSFIPDFGGDSGADFSGMDGDDDLPF